MGHRVFINVADTPISLSLANRRDRSMLSNALVKSTYNNIILYGVKRTLGFAKGIFHPS